MREFTSEEIKNRLSNIGEAIGSIALEYIVELEKENEQLQKNNKHIRDLIEAERQRQEECDDVHLRDIATLEKENKRAKVLLKAVLDLLQKQKDSHYVLNLLEATSFYDEAECDGYCLFDDIENFLNFGS